MTPYLQTTLFDKEVILFSNFIEYINRGSVDNKSSLVLNRRPAITWTSYDSVIYDMKQ